MKLFYRSSRCKKADEDRCPHIRGRRILINYAGGGCCQRSQPINCLTGLTIGGFDVCLAFNEKAIDYEFAMKNCKILTSAIGGGYWMWKPYIILRTLLAMDDGDFLFYLDSGAKFVKNFENSVLCKMAELKQDIAVFSVGLPENAYTKEEAFVLMDCNTDTCKNTWQRSGTFSMFRKSTKSVRFVSEWLTYAQDWRIISNEPSGLFQSSETNGHSYKPHRNDQSILSLLSKKWNLDLWPGFFLN